MKPRNLDREIARAHVAMRKASEVRRALPPGSSRARVTTANARWMRACEHHDRLLAERDDPPSLAHTFHVDAATAERIEDRLADPREPNEAIKGFRDTAAELAACLDYAAAVKAALPVHEEAQRAADRMMAESLARQPGRKLTRKP